MDGTNPSEIVTGLIYPAGIAIDYDSRRLFWTEALTDLVQSSNLDGTDVQLVKQLNDDTWPWGIAVKDGRLFLAQYSSGSVESSDMSGQDVEVLYNGSNHIQNLELATPNPVQTRKNPCENQTCSGKICVLNRDSFRCLA